MSPFELCYRDDASTISDRPKQLAFNFGEFSPKKGGQGNQPFMLSRHLPPPANATPERFEKRTGVFLPRKGPRKTTLKPRVSRQLLAAVNQQFVFVLEQAASSSLPATYTRACPAGCTRAAFQVCMKSKNRHEKL